MNNISIELYEYFDDILKSWDLDTEFFLTSYSDEKNSHIREHKDGLTIEFDITMPISDNMYKYTLLIPELKEKGISCDYEEYENKYEDDNDTRKYRFDLNISKYFIRNFKLKKLLL